MTAVEFGFSQILGYETLEFAGVSVLLFDAEKKLLIFNEFFQEGGFKAFSEYGLESDKDFVKVILNHLLNSEGGIHRLEFKNKFYNFKELRETTLNRRCFVIRREKIGEGNGVTVREPFFVRKKQFEVAVDAAGIGMWYSDYKAGKNYVNKHWANMLGYSLEEVEESLSFFQSIVHPEDWKLVENKWKDISLQKELKFDIILRLKTKSGDYKKVRDIGFGKIGANRSIEYAWGVHIDAEGEEEHKELYKLYKTFFSIGANPKLVLRKDPQGRAVFHQSNKAFNQLWPKPDEGSNLNHLYRLFGLESPPSHDFDYLARFDGESIQVNSAQGENEFNLKIEKVEKDENTSVLFIQFIDISEISRHTKEVKDKMLRINLATELANIGIWELDFSTSILKWDDGMKTIYESERDAISFDEWSAFVSEEDKVELITKFEQSKDRDKYYFGDFKVMVGSGKQKRIESTCKFIKNKNGKVVKAIGIDHDVTERKEYEEELLAMNGILGQIAWMHSHDLREPISKILGLAELLRLEKKAIKRDKLFEMIINSVKDLDSSIRKITKKSEGMINKKA